MQRYRHTDEARAVRDILATLPAGIQSRLRGVHFMTGYDPAWLGLHYYRETDDGRLYSETSHCTYLHNQLHLPRDRRETTIVLPEEWSAYSSFVVLHEAGHALDERLGFDRPDMKPINDYAARNRYEAFAEAFRWWANDMSFNATFYGRADLKIIDPAAVAFFDALAESET